MSVMPYTMRVSLIRAELTDNVRVLAATLPAYFAPVLDVRDKVAAAVWRRGSRALELVVRGTHDVSWNRAEGGKRWASSESDVAAQWAWLMGGAV